MSRPLTKKHGFSIVELMIVVGIIGILATMVTTNFHLFKIKAYQAEAKLNLKQIHNLEESYQSEKNTYISWPTSYGFLGGGHLCTPSNEQKALGFSISPCTETRYEYQVVTATKQEYVAYANASNLNIKCPFATDAQRIDQNGIVYFLTFGFGVNTYIFDVSNAKFLSLYCP